jgi:hypothetical protein
MGARVEFPLERLREPVALVYHLLPSAGEHRHYQGRVLGNTQPAPRGEHVEQFLRIEEEPGRRTHSARVVGERGGLSWGEEPVERVDEARESEPLHVVRVQVRCSSTLREHLVQPTASARLAPARERPSRLGVLSPKQQWPRSLSTLRRS